MLTLARKIPISYIPGDSSGLSETCKYNPLFSFPSQPVIRNRGYYRMDAINEKDKRRRNDDKAKKEAKKEEKCTKAFGGHRSLMAGIFTVYCRHGTFMISMIVPDNQ